MAASLGLLVAMLASSLLGSGTGQEVSVADVAHVRSSDVSGAPRTPGDALKGTDVRKMVASYYASVLEGNPTASGEPYEPGRYTAAHKTLPLGTELRVSRAGEVVKVVVNDRGPYVRGHDLDLSLAAAREIGLVEPGAAPVRVTVF